MTRQSREIGDMLSRALGSRSQESLAQQVGVSQEQISNYLSGKCIPPAVRIPLLAAALQLDFDTLWAATGYTTDKLLYSKDVYVTQASLGDLVGSHHELIQAISEMWEGGMPDRAITSAVPLNKTLQVQGNRYAKTKYHVEFLYLRSRLLCELGCAYTVSLTAEDALGPINDVANQQFSIAIELAEHGSNDAVPMAFAYRSLGDAYYALRKCDEAQRNYNYALSYEKNELRRMEIIRGLALTAAYKDKLREYKDIDRQIKTCLDSNAHVDARTASTLLEAEGRALALFYDPSAWTTLLHATEAMERVGVQGENLICRRLQLIRSRIVAQLYLEGLDFDKDDLVQNVEDAMTLARRHRYHKYAEEIRKLLHEFAARHPHFDFTYTVIRMFFPQRPASGARFS